MRDLGNARWRAGAEPNPHRRPPPPPPVCGRHILRGGCWGHGAQWRVGVGGVSRPKATTTHQTKKRGDVVHLLPLERSSPLPPPSNPCLFPPGLLTKLGNWTPTRGTGRRKAVWWVVGFWEGREACVPVALETVPIFRCACSHACEVFVWVLLTTLPRGSSPFLGLKW